MTNNSNAVVIDRTEVARMLDRAMQQNSPLALLNRDLDRRLGTEVREDTQAKVVFYTGLPVDKVRPLIIDCVLPTPKTLDTIAKKLGLQLLVEAVPDNVTSGLDRFSIPVPVARHIGCGLRELVVQVVQSRSAYKKPSEPIVKRRMARAKTSSAITLEVAQSILRDYGMQLQLRMI